jgi:hypothetical protein
LKWSMAVWICILKEKEFKNTLLLLQLITGKVTTCHIERRKTKR